MRVCVLGRGNYEQLCSRTRQIASHGVDLHLLSLQPGQMDHAEFHRIPSIPGAGGVGYLTIPLTVRKLIRRINPDVIDVHGVSSYGAYGFWPVGGIPIVATVYGSDVTAHAAHSSNGRIIAKRCLSRADLVYASADVARADIQRVLRVDVSNRFKYRSWGIEMHAIHQLGVKDRLDERIRLGIPSDAVVAVHNRQFCDFWRVDKLLEVAMQFCQDPSSYFLFVCPAGDALSETKIREAQASVVKSGLGDRIQFLKALPHDQMLRVFNASDIFTCFGDADLLSSSILEAMALGLVPVLRNLPAYRDVVTDGHNGYLQDELVVTDVLASFRQIASQLDHHRENFSLPNRKLIACDYDATHCSRWLVDRYAELAESKSIH